MLKGFQGFPLGFNIFEALFHIPGLRDKILIPTANSLVLQAYLLLESIKYTFKKIYNETGKSRDFSKNPGIYPVSKLNRDPGIPGIKP